MKVAYFLSMFPCWSETFILREMLELQRRGVELTIFSLKPCNETLVHPDAAAIVAQGRVVYASPRRSALRFVAAALRHPIKVAKLMRQFRSAYDGSFASLMKSYASMAIAAEWIPLMRDRGIEHIHAPWGTYPSTAALFCSRIAGMRFSFTTRAHDLFLEDHGLELKFSEARFAQTITEYNRRLIGQRYPCLVADSLHVIHSALYPDAYDAPRAPVSPPLLMSVGRLVEMKGFADLIDACALLRDRDIDFRCRIVGDGPLKDELTQRIERLGLAGRVEIAQPVPQEEIRRLLTQASCFVLPCVTARDGDQDGIPNVLTEALAARVPAISCPTSGVPELIEDEKTGLLVPQHDPQALAEAIARLLGDADLRQRVAEAGRAKVEDEFNIRKNAARMAELIAGARARPRRVVLVIDELESGGAQRQVLELAKGMKRLGLSVQIVYFRDHNAEMLGEFEAAGIRAVLIPKRRRLDIGFLLRLRRALVLMQPDVVQTYTATADLWGRAAALLARVPVLVSAARTDRMSASMKLLDPFTTAFTANSDAVLASLVRQRGVAPSDVTIIRNGISLQRYARSPQPAQPEFVVGTVARLDWQKNLPCLLKAVALQARQRPGLRLEIVGDGEERQNLTREVEALGTASIVTFWGMRDDVPELMKRWDAAVLPSWHEGQSNFLMEAMAARLPIAASDIPANRELLEGGRAGRLFAPEDPQALADILGGFRDDPASARALGEQALAVIQGYSVDTMVLRHVEMYERLMPGLARTSLA